MVGLYRAGRKASELSPAGAGEIFCQVSHQIPRRGVVLQIHILVLDVAPSPLNEDVVEHSSPAIPADHHAFSLQDAGECIADELRALVAVEDIRLAMSRRTRKMAEATLLCSSSLYNYWG